MRTSISVSHLQRGDRSWRVSVNLLDPKSNTLSLSCFYFFQLIYSLSEEVHMGVAVWEWISDLWPAREERRHKGWGAREVFFRVNSRRGLLRRIFIKFCESTEVCYMRWVCKKKRSILDCWTNYLYVVCICLSLYGIKVNSNLMLTFQPKKDGWTPENQAISCNPYAPGCN